MTAHCLRQLQPETWKIPSKPGTEELVNLLSALQETAKVPHVNNTHPLTRHLVEELYGKQQSLSGRQQTQNELKQKQLNNFNVRVELVFKISISKFFGDTGSIQAPFSKKWTSFS